MTTGLYTAVPDVRAALFDTILPAAVATIPASLTVAGTAFPITKPAVYYGDPPGSSAPNSAILVGESTGMDDETNIFPDRVSGKTRDERFSIGIRFWYLIGNSDLAAQRVATESVWAMYRALQGQLRADVTLGGVLNSPGYAVMKHVGDRDIRAIEGTAARLDASLYVFTRV